MAKNATNAVPPEGFLLEWDKTIWNVGHVFRWSDVYDGWLQDGQITVKPGDTLPEAWERDRPEEFFSRNDFNVFFVAAHAEQS